VSYPCTFFFYFYKQLREKTTEFRSRLSQGETLADIQAGLFKLSILLENFSPFYQYWMQFAKATFVLCCFSGISVIFLFCYLFSKSLEAFAVVREAARRKLGMRHFDVQVFIFHHIKVHIVQHLVFYFMICQFNFRLLEEQCFMMVA
jgi:SecA DEAD-like domain